MPTYVYFISGAGLTKIGLSENPERRLRDLQLGSPVPLTLQGTFEGNWRTEAFLHLTYADRRQHGEWFEGVYTAAHVEEIRVWLQERAEQAQDTRRRGGFQAGTASRVDPRESMRERSERLNAQARERAVEREIEYAALSPWERDTRRRTDGS